MLFLQVFIICITSSSSAFLTANIPEDGRLNFTQLATKYGYENTTEHEVTTDDGYILRIFNVPGSRSRPVLVVHGILGSSDDFILRGNTSLIIHLAEAGYDVWAGNVRGNRYSRRHSKLDADVDSAFWNYGLDELALSDLPAMIDYVLNTTEQKSLAAIGYSEGTSMFYALGAEKPEYNDKIKILISLGPVCYLNYMKEPLRTIAKFSGVLNILLKVLGQNELVGFYSGAKNLTDVLCTQGRISYLLCMVEGIFLVSGNDSEQMEEEFQRVLQGHMSAGTSRKNVYHLAQLARSGRFSKYDYGLGNMGHYGSSVAPEYDISKVEMKVALLVGSNDKIATVDNAKKLNDSLPNVVHYEVMESKKWSHFDFPFARDAHKHMFPIIFNLLDKYAP